MKVTGDDGKPKNMSMWEFSKSMNRDSRLERAGNDMKRAGGQVSRVVYGTLACVLVLFILYVLAQAA